MAWNRRVFNRRMDEGRAGEHLSLQRNAVYVHTGTCHGRQKEPGMKHLHGKYPLDNYDTGAPKRVSMVWHCPCCTWPPRACPACMKMFESQGCDVYKEPAHPDDLFKKKHNRAPDSHPDAPWVRPGDMLSLNGKGIVVVPSDDGPSAMDTTSGSASSAANGSTPTAEEVRAEDLSEVRRYDPMHYYDQTGLAMKPRPDRPKRKRAE